MKTKANGITINYQIDGPEGAPWIIFSNSLATSTAMWDDQAAALKDKFRVLRYDQRGHGGTEVPAGRYAFSTLLADAIGVSALSGGLSYFAIETLRLLSEQDAEIPVIAGGIDEPKEIQRMLEAGVFHHFGPGASLDEIVTVFEGAATARRG